MKRQQKQRPTIEDVAAKAGLSVSTVSLVINNKSYVSEETRKKVKAVIAELDYHPQRSARGLASRSSGNIGFILTNEHFSQAEPFYTKIFLGTELEARQQNYYVLLTTVGYNIGGVNDMPRFFLEHNVDGVIIAGKIGSSWLDYISERNLPMILIDYELPDRRISTVVMDNSGGARMVVEHLLSLGHTKIGFIGGDIRHPSIAARYQTYRRTLEQHGVDVRDAWVNVDEANTRFENGYRAAQAILTEASDKPTAIVSANDALALGCMKYCKEVGLNIPGSMAVAGFDNVESGLQSQPRLTTVNVHREEMGGLAVRRLVEMIRDKSIVVDRSISPVELVVRESCGGKKEAEVEDSAVPIAGND